VKFKVVQLIINKKTLTSLRFTKITKGNIIFGSCKDKNLEADKLIPPSSYILGHFAFLVKNSNNIISYRGKVKITYERKFFFYSQLPLQNMSSLPVLERVFLLQ
jgi:hypothetical protein